MESENLRRDTANRVLGAKNVTIQLGKGLKRKDLLLGLTATMLGLEVKGALAGKKKHYRKHDKHSKRSLQVLFDQVTS